MIDFRFGWDSYTDDQIIQYVIDKIGRNLKDNYQDIAFGGSKSLPSYYYVIDPVFDVLQIPKHRRTKIKEAVVEWITKI